jgi:hypothetical protein
MSEQRAPCKQIKWPRKPRFFMIAPDQGVGGQDMARVSTFLLGAKEPVICRETFNRH